MGIAKKFSTDIYDSLSSLWMNYEIIICFPKQKEQLMGQRKNKDKFLK